ncbi:hypothetical protein GCM10028791_12010 [Echinicola sediminis]
MKWNWFKKQSMLLLLGAFICGGTLPAKAQEQLSFERYIKEVLDFHPLSMKAQLNLQKSVATLRTARGNFDPEVGAAGNQKLYEDKLYYRKLSSELRVPTLVGLDVVAGYEKNVGRYLNPENQTAANGLVNAGIELNVLQGLLMDERRTALRKAKAFANIAEQQQFLESNELYFNAAEAYLHWANSHQSLQVVEESVVLAKTYFDNTKASYENGEKTAMDTLEAYTMWQDRLNLLQAAMASFTATSNYLNNYLSAADSTVQAANFYPDELGQVIASPVTTSMTMDSLYQLPEIQQTQFQIKALEAERRMKQEKLLPKLKLKYMPLLTPDGDGLPGFNQNDYKWGFDFSFPLLLRKERGDVQLSKIKVLEKQYELEYKSLATFNKITNSQAQIDLITSQLTNQSNNLEGYERLLWAENEKFKLGESSVFLLNKRQEKLLEAQLKFIDLQTKQQLSYLKYQYYTNRLLPETAP